MKNNTDKVALVSGGLGDIGRTIAILLGQHGVRVAISDLIRKEEAKPRLEEMRKKGCKKLFYQKADVSAEQEVANWLEAVEKKMGGAPNYCAQCRHCRCRCSDQ